MLDLLILPVENLHFYLKIISDRDKFYTRKIPQINSRREYIKKLKKLKRNNEKNNNYRNYSEGICNHWRFLIKEKTD
ncbi:MAG TPA: hypothetical protein DHW42_02515 [Candidatus Marinimicrobia bacterium]|nr:hypothetical protein [Candidatus Neomarinimicrobiota bacterium]